MRRFLVRALIALVAGVATAFIVYQTSVQPGAALVRSVFQRGAQVNPPAGFAAAEENVTEVRVPIHAPGAPAAAIDVYRPRASAAAPRPVILWIHGGGFLANTAAQFRDWAAVLAHQGYVVALLDYSLAPQTPYPAPVRQANAALAYLSGNAARFGGDPARVAVGGDSAGAQIASQVAAVETNPRLAAAMTLTPGVASSHLKAVVLAGVLRSRGVPVATLFWHDQGLGHEYQFKFNHPQAGVNFTRTLAFLAQRLTGSGAHG